jgi:hypothetical protein
LLQIGFGLIDSGAGLPHIRFRLMNLFIQFRRLDDRKRLAGVNTIADIDKPLLDIAVCTGKDGGFSSGLNIARQLQAAVARRLAYGHYRYAWQSAFPVLSFIGDEPVSMKQWNVSGKKSNYQEH